MKKWIPAGLILAFLVLSFSPVFAQESRAQMQKEIVRLKYLDGMQVQPLLRLYLSRDGNMTWSPQNDQIISISDYPENIEKVLAVLKEIDVKPVDLLFTIQLVVGTESQEGKTDASLENDPVIKDLKNLLKYRTYTLLDTALVRALEKERSRVILGKNAEFSLDLRPRYIKEEKEDLILSQVSLVQYIRVETPPNVESSQRRSTNLIESNLTLKSGEKTVVGVSKMDGGERGVILIISGKVIR